MDQPIWNDYSFRAGTMVRGALWLLQVIGEGNTFTKNELRAAFPGVSQVDRRIRALRDFGWVLHSNIEDASLLAEDQRFVKAGVAVWNARDRKEAEKQKPISTKDRKAVLKRDNYMCTLCGISGAETYPDDQVMSAVLAISRRTILTLDGTESQEWVTECKRCRSGDDGAPIDMRDAVIAVENLSPGERRRLLGWMERGRRGSTPIDRAWAAYLRVPADNRPKLIKRLGATGQAEDGQRHPTRSSKGA